MKKTVAFLLVVSSILCFAACSKKTETPAPTVPTEVNEPTEETTPYDYEVMTYAQFEAADPKSNVVVDTYVQDVQIWENNEIVVYCQSEDGAYFVNKLVCSENDAVRLLPGVKLRITGTKEVVDGRMQIDGGFPEFLPEDTYIAEPVDVTELLGGDDLIKYQNKKVAVTGLTVENVVYENDAPGSDNDIFITLSLNDQTYDFRVESHLTNPDNDVYITAGELKAGDIIDVEAYLCWNNGAAPHITSITIN